MIGDKIVVKEKYLVLANNVLDLLNDPTMLLKPGLCIAISGESGCGKSTLAFALQKSLIAKGWNPFVFHMDDYFRLPPKSNHESRLADLKNVGPHEVDLELLDSHLRKAKIRKDNLVKPLIHYHENVISSETVNCAEHDMFIVEGTYCALLNQADYKIFMTKNYIQTEEARIKRNRDPKGPYIHKVLNIEHQIIKEHYAYANVLVDHNNQVLKP